MILEKNKIVPFSYAMETISHCIGLIFLKLKTLGSKRGIDEAPLVIFKKRFQ